MPTNTDARTDAMWQSPLALLVDSQRKIAESDSSTNLRYPRCTNGDAIEGREVDDDAVALPAETE